MISVMCCLVLASLSSVLFVISILFSPKTVMDRSGLTPFECGFDASGLSRLPFSLRFYLIAIIFLIFDVEITFLLPLIPGWSSPSPATIVSGLLFLSILLGGTIYEWKEGSLNWAE
uniref:NADH-ubiquinone oxidoreductase chain 3 n=1 Tax=Pleurocryptella fimbriata TaxID=2480055 RepID=A0A8K1Y3K1_9CRUS|nr:NADH dehydrogenase subunit 3 [Pleurocryptella fimbriata]